jgi:membrane protease YdiL (CAAX protease family)
MFKSKQKGHASQASDILCPVPVYGGDGAGRTRFPRCDPPWGIGSVVVVFALYLLFSFALAIIIAVLDLHAGTKISPLAQLLASLVSEGLLAALVLGAVRIRHHSSLEILGLCGTSWRDLFYYGIGSGFGISLLMIASMGLFLSLFHLNPQPQPVVDLIVSAAHDRWLLPGYLLLAGVFAPICEEMYFRGFVYPVLRRRFGISAAVLITSCLFAAVHFDLVRFLFLALLGAFLAITCEKTRSLIPAVAAHSAYNLVSIILLLLH